MDNNLKENLLSNNELDMVSGGTAGSDYNIDDVNQQIIRLGDEIGSGQPTATQLETLKKLRDILHKDKHMCNKSTLYAISILERYGLW